MRARSQRIPNSTPILPLHPHGLALNSTGGSILLVAIFHAVRDLATVNRAVGLELMNVSGMLYTLWGLAVLVLVRPTRLARAPKVVWQAGGTLTA